MDDLLEPSTLLTSFFDGDGQSLIRTIKLWAAGCRGFSSKFGRIGYAPETALEGDQVVIFYGVPAPLVIRKVEPGYFRILGPAYVYGVMEGEFLRDGHPPSKTFFLV